MDKKYELIKSDTEIGLNGATLAKLLKVMNELKA
jgi:hypothetical protein